MDRTRLTALTLSVLLLAGCAQASPAPAESGPPQTAGSVSLPDVPSGPNVQTDWSRLDGNKAALQPDADGGRWYPDYTGGLVPSEDYGPLVPYAGALTYSFNTWTDDSGQEQVWYSSWPTSLYGLMTREGKIVTDPVYLSAEQAEFYWQGHSTALPVLLLSQAREEWNDFCNGRRYAAAALDGNWCTGFDFWNYTTREDELLFYGPGGVTWIDAVSGARQDWSWEFLGVSEEDLPQMVDRLMWVYGFIWTDRGVYLGEEATGDRGSEGQDSPKVRIFRPDTLEVSWISRQEWEDIYDKWWDQRIDTAQDAEVQREGTQLTLTRGEEHYTLTLPDDVAHLGTQTAEDYCVVTDYTGNEERAWLYRLSDGTQLWELPAINLLYDRARPEERPYFQTLEDGVLCLYDMDLNLVLSVSPGKRGSNSYCTLRDGLLTVRDDQTFFGCWDLDAGTCIFYRNLDLGD